MLHAIKSTDPVTSCVPFDISPPPPHAVRGAGGEKSQHQRCQSAQESPLAASTSSTHAISRRKDHRSLQAPAAPTPSVGARITARCKHQQHQRHQSAQESPLAASTSSTNAISWRKDHRSLQAPAAPTPPAVANSASAASESQGRKRLMILLRVPPPRLDQILGVATVEQEKARRVAGGAFVVLEERLQDA